MKKRISLLLAAGTLLLTSCATAGAFVKTHIANPDSSLAAVSKDEYVILGTVSGTGTIVAPDKEIIQEREALSAGVRPDKDIILEGDTRRYGYLNDPSYAVQTAEEKAVANAVYNMIEQALFNGADAVICVKTRTSIIPVVNENGSRNVFNPKSRISANVSGIAVKLKDQGTGIKEGLGPQEDLDPAGTLKAQKAAAKKAAADAASETKDPSADQPAQDTQTSDTTDGQSQ
jgi:hypothetical protein